MMAPRSLLTLMALAALSGCSGILQSDAPADQTYFLRAASTQPPSVAPAGPSLRIGRTFTAPGLDSDRIMLIEGDRRMGYYASSRWAAPIPIMVEELAVDTLRASGVWSAVHSQGTFAAEYYLQIDIRRFEADYTEGANPKIHVVLNCTFGRRTDREVMTTFMAEGSEVAAGNRMSAVVAAFEAATHAALVSIADKSRQAIKASAAK